MQPLVSFVATSRNDDHGGDVLRRTQSFVNGLAKQAERHKVAVELVLVDWNPPRSRAPLMDVLDWPKGSAHFMARVVSLPFDLHATLRHSEKLAMFQMIAKNVGIRRAKGAYIAATNIDIVFSDELFASLRRDALRPGALYRSDRWDIPNEIQLETDFDRLLARARAETIRRNMIDGTYVLKDGAFVNSTQGRLDWMVLNPIEEAARRAEYLLSELHQPQLAAQMMRDLYDRLIPDVRRNFQIPLLHTNGCGDYTLMSREDWFAMRGYPEWHVFSWAIDSVFIYQAHYNGHEVLSLPADHTHYHIEHDYGSGWTPDGASTLWTRLDQRCIPYLKYDETMELFHELRERGARGEYTVYNDLGWGFADSALDIETVAADNAPARPARAVNDGPLKEVFDPAAGLAGIDLDPTKAYRPVPDAKHAVLAGGGGGARLKLKTPPLAWTYAAGYDIRPEMSEGGEWWLRMKLRVTQGAVSAGILNLDQSKFLATSVEMPAGEEREEFLFIRDGRQISCLMFRNASKDVVSEAEILSLSLFCLRRADGAPATQADIDAIAAAAALDRASPRVPPLPPAAPRTRNVYTPADLADFSACAEGVETERSDEGLVVTTARGSGVRALRYALAGDRADLRLSLDVLEGAVDAVLIGADEADVIAETGVIAEGTGRMATLEARGARALALRNRRDAPSRVRLAALEIGSPEAFDFVAAVRAAACYETSKEATFVAHGERVSTVTPPQPGAYAVGWDLRTVFAGGGPRRLSVRIRVAEGAARLGVRDAGHNRWVALSEPIGAGAAETIELDAPDADDASVLILVNENHGVSKVEVDSVVVSGPWRFLARVAPHSPYLRMGKKTRLKFYARRLWDSRYLAPVRRAAPGSLRQMWRRLYGSVRA